MMQTFVRGALAIAALSPASGCFESDDSPDAAGAMHLSWTVTRNGAAVAMCSEVGAAEVEVLTTDSQGAGLADQFPCDRFEGETFALAPGLYAVQVNILDGRDPPVALQQNLVEMGVPVTAGDVTELGTYRFDFQEELQAHVSFFADFGAAGGGPNDNCTRAERVVLQHIELHDRGSATCLDVTITNAFGAGDGCGGRLVCTEVAEANTADLPAGSYDVRLVGYKGAVGDETYPCHDSGLVGITVDAPTHSFTINAPRIPGADPRCTPG